MKLINGWKRYKKCIRTFGFLDGCRMFLSLLDMRVRRSEKKKEFAVRVPRLKKQYLYLRKNSTDLFLAMELLCKDGEYDFMLEEPYRALLENAQVIVDAGANIGLFSLICKSINSRAKIICIEPESDNYHLLSKNVIDGTCYKNGLWNKDAKLQVVPRNTGEWGFIVKEVEESASNTDVIEAISIDSIMNREEINHIDILKIDIEGSEYELFDETAEAWLDQVKCLIIELHDRIKEGCSKRVLERMASHDFSYSKYGENYVFIKKQLER
ncbi:MAG: FkbM family methyltransferase [Lachnospiraceae bacterium]